MATGFIAKNTAGQVTTLKRNGSDYSATIMGALVLSSNIVIWTDVDGVYSADPRKVGRNLFKSLILKPCQGYHGQTAHDEDGTGCLHPDAQSQGVRSSFQGLCQRSVTCKWRVRVGIRSACSVLHLILLIHVHA